MRQRHRLGGLLCIGVVLGFAATAPAATISDFALFGGKTTTLASGVSVTGGLVGSNDIVSIASNDTVLSVTGGSALSMASGVTANGGIAFNGHVSISANARVTGDIDTGGNLTIASGARVDGNIRAAGTVSVGSNAKVGGSIDAGGNVHLGSGATVGGAITHPQGVTITGSGTHGGEVVGTPAPPQVFTAVSLPSPTSFTSGGANVTGGGTHTLGPDSYGTLHVSSGSTLNLSAGSYFFDSFQIAANGTLNFDLSDGDILLFVTGDTNLSSGLHVNLINGTPGDIYLETGGDFHLASNAQWMGTVFAGEDITIASGGPIAGAFYATGHLSVAANRTVNYAPADYLQAAPDPAEPTQVPSAGTLALVASGLAAIGVALRHRSSRR